MSVGAERDDYNSGKVETERMNSGLAVSLRHTIEIVLKLF